MNRPTITDIVEQLPKANMDNEQRRALSEIKDIIVHYDAQNVRQDGPYDHLARFTAQTRYHIQKNWVTPPRFVPGFGLMYHYKITADGKIYKTQPETLVTWQANNANRRGLGVCCDLGSNQEPTKAQLAALAEVLNWLTSGRPDIPAGRSNVWGHIELKADGNSTLCPGRLLPYVQRYRAGTWALNTPPTPIPLPPPPAPRPEIELMEATGYTVAGGFLQLWRDLEALRPGLALAVLGWPKSYEYVDPATGRTYQDFENGGVEWYVGIQPRIRAANREYRDHMLAEHGIALGGYKL